MAAISKRIVEYIKARPNLAARIGPIANGYMDVAGYRKIGLRYSLNPNPNLPILQSDCFQLGVLSIALEVIATDCWFVDMMI